MSNKYNFVKKDYENIDTLVKISKSISNIYDRLYQLEEKCDKDSLIYNDTLNYLCEIIKRERQIYKSLKLDDVKINNYMSFLINEFGFDNKLDFITEQNYKNIEIRRIIFNLEAIASTYRNLDKELVNGLFNFITSMQMDNKNDELVNAMKNITELDSYFEKDILNLFLTILEDCFVDCRYSKYRENLIKTKYVVSYVNHEIEKDIIQDKFDVSDSVYLNSQWYADYLRINRNVYQLLRNTYGVDQACFQMIKLLNTADSEYKNNKKASSSMLRQCLLRSALLFLDDDVILNIKKDFVETIENCNFESYREYRISKNAIMQCLRKHQKDKEKCNQISLVILPHK